MILRMIAVMFVALSLSAFAQEVQVQKETIIVPQQAPVQAEPVQDVKPQLQVVETYSSEYYAEYSSASFRGGCRSGGLCLARGAVALGTRPLRGVRARRAARASARAGVWY